MIKINKKLVFRSVIVAVLALSITGTYAYTRPLPPLTYTAQDITIDTGTALSLPWPGYGQSALGAEGYGLLASNGNQKPASIASVAKVITALAVLKQKPLAPAEQGAIITLDATDVGYYNYYYTNDGSVARVVNGEQISQYQALQALLLPSANNIADSLARWAFGSIDAYSAYANSMVKDLGLTQTTVGGPSGFDDKTTSTAEDLVKLGLYAINNPVLAEIVNQQQASLPVAGAVSNVNWLLGRENVNGIKTGNTEQAGGCYLYSSVRDVNGQKITVVGAVLGGPTRNKAITDSIPIITASTNGFNSINALNKDQIIGRYSSKWGSSSNAIAQKDISFTIWKGQTISSKVDVNTKIGAQPKATVVGKVSMQYLNTSKDSNIILDKNIDNPSLLWRIFRR